MSGFGRRLADRLPVATNHRGRPVGVWLGVALTVGVSGLLLATVLAGWIATGRLAPWRHHVLWIAAGALIVCGAGLYDDLRPARTRGIVRQIAALGRGSVTPGVVKMVLIVAASAAEAWVLGARGVRFALGIPVVAGSANLFNLLDVRPGRCLKWFLLVAVPMALATTIRDVQTVLILFAAGAIVALLPDLREVAMLGDAGSNVLGFVVGIGLMQTLGIPALSVALVAIVALHVVSETVTLSRVIDAVPPLRWFDGMGRLPEAPQ